MNTTKIQNNIEIKKRNSVNCYLSMFDILAKDSDFIEVTEWTNGEGWDISINERIFHLTHGQLDAINYLTKHLDIYYLNDEINRK